MYGGNKHNTTKEPTKKVGSFVVYLVVPTEFEPAERNWFSAYLSALQARHRYQWISNGQLRELCRSKLEAQSFGKALLGIWDEYPLADR